MSVFRYTKDLWHHHYQLKTKITSKGDTFSKNNASVSGELSISSVVQAVNYVLLASFVGSLSPLEKLALTKATLVVIYRKHTMTTLIVIALRNMRLGSLSGPFRTSSKTCNIYQLGKQ